jgi:hypothetical protein
MIPRMYNNIKKNKKKVGMNISFAKLTTSYAKKKTHTHTQQNKTLHD